MYELESLIETFVLHHKQRTEANKKLIKVWQKNYPDEALPDYLHDEFSLPLALEAICREIQALKDKLQ